MTTKDVLDKYIAFFEKRGHKRIVNSPLVPENDPTTLFTSSGMQPLVSYLLGEIHPSGKRLVNVQNCFRSQDIDEVGDNRHTTFFRMLGNWSLGDYFKKEQLPWFFEFLTDKKEGLGIDPTRLFVTVFGGNSDIPKDEESIAIWKEIFKKLGIEAKEGERICTYGVEKNWWSRSGVPDKMPPGEPGGPDSEVFYDFGEELRLHEMSQWKNEKCHVNCDCGRYIEIGNSVFMQFLKQPDETFRELTQKNVDFGGGLERLLMAVEDKTDIFETSLFSPIIKSIELVTSNSYLRFKPQMRIAADHLVASVFMVHNGVVPSNKEQGYILRRLIRRALDNINLIRGMEDINVPTRGVVESIIEQYKQTDSDLIENPEKIINMILEELNIYRIALDKAQRFIQHKYQRTEDELKGVTEITSEDAFDLYQSHGLSPTQIKSLGFKFDEHEFSELMKKHQKVSRAGVEKKFRGGLADNEELTIKGHTATHLLHQALRDVLGDFVHQTGSNITTERVRFDYAYDKKLTPEQIKEVEEIVLKKIAEKLPVFFKIMPLSEARKIGAIGLFDEKYSDVVKVYIIGGAVDNTYDSYSKEFCGGPHVGSTGEILEFHITKDESLGRGNRRIYAIVK